MLEEHKVIQCDNGDWLLVVKSNNAFIVVDQIPYYEVMKLKEIYKDCQINKHLDYRFGLLEKRLIENE